MITRRSPAPTCLAALGLAAVLAAGCDGPAGEATARAEPAAGPAVARVAVVKPERATIRRTTEQPAQIEAVETTPIYAKIAGYVESVAVDYGDEVKQGQVLATLRVPEVEARAKQKRAEVTQAEVGRKQAEAALAVAEAGVESARAKVQEIRSGIRRAEADVGRWQAEYARVEQLARERAQTGSLLDETRSKLRAAEAGRDEVNARVQSADAALDEAEALRERARADVQAAAARIEVARFEAEDAAAMAGYARIVAPFDGIVTRRGIDTGHLTTPGTAGEPLFVVARSGVVTVAVAVPEVEAPLVAAGDPASVRLQALDGRTFAGRVARTAWALEPATRTLRAEIDLPDEDGVLRPGLYAYATIIAEEHKDVLTVPTSAIVSDGGKTYCVTVDAGRARRVEVRAGLGDGKRTEVLDGIGEADSVVEANAASLADGQAVEVAQPPADAPKPKG